MIRGARRRFVSIERALLIALLLVAAQKDFGPFSLLAAAGPGFEHHRDGAQFSAYVALGLGF